MKSNKPNFMSLILIAALSAGLLLLATDALADNDLGAWYGDNNLTNYYTADPNADGGTVQMWRKRDNVWSWKDMSNKDRNAATNNDGTDRTFQVVPDTGNNYQIKFIKYATASNWSDSNNRYNSVGTWQDVVVSTPTANTQFTISNINDDYVIWVVFEKSNSAASFTVTADVYQETDAASANYICNNSTIFVTGQSPGANPQQAIKTGVIKGNTASFSYTPASGCEVDSVKFNSGAYVAYTTNTYVTEAIQTDSTVSVKFRKVSLVITSSIAASSPTGSGEISPLGNTPVALNGSQTFTITPTTANRILKVVVIDPAAGYTTATDLGGISTYTFNNVTGSGSITVTFAADTTTTDSYCQIPPFISGQSSLTPNVLIDFDNSGSMDSKAYQINNSTYSSTTNYYGYFDSAKMYKLNDATKTYSIDTVAGLNKTVSCTNVTTTACSGNRLNFDLMTKVDVVRKVLTGGKTVDRTATTKFLKLRNNYLIEYGTAEPTGIVQNLAGKVRFGLMVLNGSHTGEIVTKLGEPVGDLVAAIEGTKTDPNGWTPLAHTLYEAVRYFEAKESAYGSTDYGTMDPIQYACQKHFVLVLTDGVPNNNNNLPGSGSISDLALSPDTFDVTTWVGRLTAADKVAPDADGEKMAAVAYYAHNTDLRSATVGKTDILGTQNLTFYTVYTFGSDSERAAAQGALKATSKYGAYQNTNANGSLTYASPDLTSEWDKNGDGLPDTYFAADQGDTLAANISSAMTDILAKVASGTAASILSNSEGSGANLLQAVFYPNKIFKNGTQVNWIGEMQNMWYYVDPFVANSTIREDTDYSGSGDHILNLKDDYATTFYFSDSETFAELKKDINGDGLGDTVISTKMSPDDVKSIWRAGKNLWSRSDITNPRTIHTSIDGQSLYYPTTDSKGGFYSATTRATGLKDYLQAADVAESQKLIDYIRGTDQAGYRSRKVSLVTNVAPTVNPAYEWKLGDIIASTPRLQSTSKLNIYNLDSPAGYGDKSYNKFVTTDAYKQRGMVYVGANDGMLHAFKLGKLTVSGPSITGYTKASLSGTGLGDEQWAYIPRNALPYLKYFADPNSYKHIYYVDGPTVLLDAAVAKTSGCTDDYSACAKDESAGSNWKTILIGSMGLGGASRLKGDSCANGASGTCVKTPIFDPTDTAATKTKGIGFSSYFALDVTGQYFNSSTGALANQPTLSWEFSHPELGYATSGAAIVRISAKKADPSDASKTVSDPTKNGKTFAVFVSGPTGSIDETAHQFMGKSDQNLKFFVVDLGATGALTLNTNYWIIDTGIPNAFGGSMVDAASDTDRWNKAADGNYQDDVVYVGYTQANSDTITPSTLWTRGGVVRLVTKEDINPANWKTSIVISGVGPVTAGVSRLQDRKTHKLWLYFGSGRFYYGGDDPSNRRYILGVKDSCYQYNDTFNRECGDTPPAALTLSSLKNVLGITTDCDVNDHGWYFALRAESGLMGAERVITNPVALTNGMVQFTTFKPTTDVCKFGGDSYLWPVKYDTGCAPPPAACRGKVLLQVSTGAFEEKDACKPCVAGSADCPNPPDPPCPTPPCSKPPMPSDAMTGKPPSDPPPIVTNAGNKPQKKILHLQEK